MLGYMTKSEAVAHGFTHHGRYYFLPIYIATGDIPMVAVKFIPLEFLFDWLLWLEYHLTIEGEIPNFTVGDPIVAEYLG